MILVLGFRTPAYSEIPTILYLGADGDEANRIIDTDPHPRIEKVINPTLHSVKHWDETASAAFEKKHGEKRGAPAVANVYPHLEPGASVMAPGDVTSGGTLSSPEGPADPPPDDAGNGLDDLTIEQLKALAEEKGIDISGCKLKQEYLETIRLYLALDAAYNAEEIKTVSADEGVEMEGLKLKRDFVNAIVAKRRSEE
jgi:hypothetical protein